TMTPRRIGLASRVGSVTVADLARVAAAINLQVSRDFQPIWQISAVISALPDPDSVPPGVWPIFLVDDTGYDGADGLHLTKVNQPFALVRVGPAWSLTVAHETLEMLVDPSGNKLQTSTAIEIVNGAVRDVPGRKVDYLVEVADPSEDSENAYFIDDVLVCDFYTPNFFDPVPAGGVRYSFSGKLSRPRQILKNGYISWHDPLDGHMHQLRYFDAPEIVALGHPSTSNRGSLRGFVDSVTPPPIALSQSDITRAAGGYQRARSHWMQTASAQQSSAYTLAALRSTPGKALPGADPVIPKIKAHANRLLPKGATRAYAGWRFRDGWITRQRAIVVQASREDLETVRHSLPASVDGVPIEARADPREDRTPAGVAGLFAMAPGTARGELALPAMPGEITPEGGEALADAVVASHVQHKPRVDYESPPGRPFEKITASMTLRVHVSPERGWPELEGFLTSSSNELVIGMYQCTAPHIEAAIEQGLGEGGELVMTMDSPPDGKKREQTVEQTEEDLEKKLKSRINFAWALSGLGKEAPALAFPTAYHIKVAVKNKNLVWISSGNFNTANQPEVDFNDRDSLAKAAQSSDRDWHVICESPEVASFFRAYLRNDYDTASKAAGGVGTAALTAAAAAAPPPALDDLAGLLAARPKTYFDTKVITGEITVRPLLTPDVNGYRAPILELIKSAKHRFYMQTQYIHTIDDDKDSGAPSHMDLIRAVADLIQDGVDVKLITSEYQDAMWIERLQDAGVDAVEHLRIQNRVHNKGIVVDSKVSVISSQNWSSQGTGTNRDAGLIIYNEEVSRYLEEIFLHDWTNLARARLPH
ncbi:MAG: phospholipase D-like domain-containing protein, partial [Candidatus Eiseniibacteriota bacterium]